MSVVQISKMTLRLASFLRVLLSEMKSRLIILRNYLRLIICSLHIGKFLLRCRLPENLAEFSLEQTQTNYRSLHLSKLSFQRCSWGRRVLFLPKWYQRAWGYWQRWVWIWLEIYLLSMRGKNFVILFIICSRASRIFLEASCMIFPFRSIIHTTWSFSPSTFSAS